MKLLRYIKNKIKIYRNIHGKNNNILIPNLSKIFLKIHIIGNNNTIKLENKSNIQNLSLIISGSDNLVKLMIPLKLI
jgi:hypothetical protein